MTYRKIAYSLSIILLFPFLGVAGGGESKNAGQGSDTLTAIVMYGKSFLLDELSDFSRSSVEAYRDSLKTLSVPPQDLIRQIDLYLGIEKMGDNEIVALIDSLFETDLVPYALINQINLYVANRPPPVDPFAYIDTCSIPGSCFYNGQWNTLLPNPYLNDLAKNDTVQELLLQSGDYERISQYVTPVDNVITSKFGWREGKNHNGIDVDLEVWDTVGAAFDGMVRVARYYGGYGRVVVVRHYNGLETTYAHLHRLKVKPGQVVKAGEVIGLGGSSGHSTGSHLHFEVRFKGVPINPLNIIDYNEKRLINDTLILKKTTYGYAAFPKGATLHTVKRGDCLYDIAKKYGTTTTRLARLNGIRRNSRLSVGQQLRVI